MIINLDIDKSIYNKEGVADYYFPISIEDHRLFYLNFSSSLANFIRNKTLVNHKTYYFMALAYSFNGAEINANPYNPLDGQNQPYKQGRKNIFSL